VRDLAIKLDELLHLTPKRILLLTDETIIVSSAARFFSHRSWIFCRIEDSANSKYSVNSFPMMPVQSSIIILLGI